MIQGVVEKIKEVYFAGQDSKMDFFMENWESSKKSKARLIELLGGEEHTIDITMDADAICETFPHCFAKVKRMVQLINGTTEVPSNDDIVKNTFDGKKLSRFIIKNKDKVTGYKNLISFYHIQHEIGICTEDIERFFRTFCEKVAAMKSEKVVLSVNYIDILSAGNVSGENSCYALSIFRDRFTRHGAYSLAPHAFAQDSNTLIAYVPHPNGKKFSKRVWVHINNENDRFAIGRLYGNWGSNTLKILYREIEKILGEQNSSNWNRRSDIGGYLSGDVISFTNEDDFQEYGRPFYCGDSAAYIFRKIGSDSSFYMDTPCRVPCMSCGSDHGHLEGSGMCYDCTRELRRGRICDYCGEEHSNMSRHAGHSYCPRCVYQVHGIAKTCSQCHNEFTSSGNMRGGEIWCPTCYEARRAAEREARRDRELAAELEWEQRQRAIRADRRDRGIPTDNTSYQWRNLTAEMIRAAERLNGLEFTPITGDETNIVRHELMDTLIEPPVEAPLNPEEARLSRGWMVAEPRRVTRTRADELMYRSVVEEPTW